MLKFVVVAHLTYENQWVSLRNKVRNFGFFGTPYFIVLNICTIEIGNYVFNRKLLEFKPDEFKGPDDGKTLEVCESL